MGVALYGRVSSNRQEHEETIRSQLAELRHQAKEDDLITWLELLDEGYGRDNLTRPGLDRLRDLVGQGEINRVYVQAHDRLASGAGLVLLVEELREKGVEVVFLKGSVEDTAEGKLLLHMQGAIAEYERTKIAERTRRGKLYWARQGAMVGGHAPYGYNFRRRTDAGRAKLEINEFEAAVVREIYRWLIDEQLSTRAIAKRLTERDIATSKGAAQWQPTAVDRILRNQVYKGTFVYQRTERTLPSQRTSSDPYRRSRKTGRKQRPQEEWIKIPVPIIASDATWEAAQQQLVQNSKHSKRNNKCHRYLLRGLRKCPRCGSTYTGAVQHGYRRYRCGNTDPGISSTGKRCPPGSIGADLLEQLIWDAVAQALRQPDVLVEQYRRLLDREISPDGLAWERKQVALALKRIKSQEDRLTDAYRDDAMDLKRYKMEMDQLKAKKRELERTSKDIDSRERQEWDSRGALKHLQDFCDRVAQGLDSLTFEDRQQLLRLVIERITVADSRVSVETVIPVGTDAVHLRTGHPELIEGC